MFKFPTIEAMGRLVQVRDFRIIWVNGWKWQSGANEQVYFVAISCTGNTLFKAKTIKQELPQEMWKIMLLFVGTMSICLPNDATIPYMYQSFHSFWSGKFNGVLVVYIAVPGDSSSVTLYYL